MNNWTPAEDKRARELLDAGADNETFLREMNRTKGAAKSRMVTIKFHVMGATKPRESRKDPHSRIPERLIVPPQVMEDAARRANAPRSITALMFGDPPIGFSALERRA